MRADWFVRIDLQDIETDALRFAGLVEEAIALGFRQRAVDAVATEGFEGKHEPLLRFGFRSAVRGLRSARRVSCLALNSSETLSTVS